MIPAPAQARPKFNQLVYAYINGGRAEDETPNELLRIDRFEFV